MNHRFVPLRLAGDAGADAGKRLAPFLGDRPAAIVAFLRALALRSQRPRAKDRVLHRIVDLALLFLWRSNVGMEAAARNRRSDRAFESVLADGSDAEHPIVDAYVRQDHL